MAKTPDMISLSEEAANAFKEKYEERTSSTMYTDGGYAGYVHTMFLFPVIVWEWWFENLPFFTAFMETVAFLGLLSWLLPITQPQVAIQT